MSANPKGRSPWRLPRGVVAGVWDYLHSEEIASQFDDYFGLHPLFELDRQVIDHYFASPGWVVDLGCGTGRSLLPLAERGFSCVGVDLSREMLLQMRGKAADLAPGGGVHAILANLVELDGLRDGIFDYALCLFSTLGMIQGRENRRSALAHIRRTLKPGGTFILHVHNTWQHLRTPQGRWWLLHGVINRILRRPGEFGDKTFFYRGIPNMFVHAFTYAEIRADLRGAGFYVQECVSLAAGRNRPLAAPWFMGRLRANGWILVCR